MTTTSTATVEDLQTRLADYQRQGEEAERELGAAALDGKGLTAATKRRDQAREALKRTEAALAELERREEQARQHEAEREAARARREVYLWMVEYLKRIERQLQAQAALDDAATHLRSLGNNRLLRLMAYHGPKRARELGIDPGIEPGLLRCVPEFPRGGKGLVQYHQSITPDRCRSMRQRAEELAATELAGAEALVQQARRPEVPSNG